MSSNQIHLRNKNKSCFKLKTWHQTSGVCSLRGAPTFVSASIEACILDVVIICYACNSSTDSVTLGLCGNKNDMRLTRARLTGKRMWTKKNMQQSNLVPTHKCHLDNLQTANISNTVQIVNDKTLFCILPGSTDSIMFLIHKTHVWNTNRCTTAMKISALSGEMNSGQ